MEAELRTILKNAGRLGAVADTIDPQADLFASGLSSLATVDVMLAVEDAFGVEFPDALLCRRTFRTLSSLGGVVGNLREVAAAR